MVNEAKIAAKCNQIGPMLQDCTREDIKEILAIIAAAYNVNPVREYLESLIDQRRLNTKNERNTNRKV
jgi:hypothetical protein